jgi:transcriptional regulator of acetoin/glycerol metabolism
MGEGPESARTGTIRSTRQVREDRVAPALFLVLACDHPTALPARISLAGVERLEIGRGPAAALTSNDGGRALRLDVPDLMMSSTHARLRNALDGLLIEDAGSKNGTVIGGARQQQAVLRDGDWIELGHTLFRFRERVPAEAPALIGPTDPGGAPELSTVLPELTSRFERLTRAARAGLPILVLGETGTGKELVAHAIHRLAGRRGELVAVNCGAISPSLIESELFGHRKGAFSGAGGERVGLIRRADGGTLLLDEVGELELSSQAALLRVLQEREVLPVGADRPVRVDLQLVSATHRDLELDVAEGRFREDLLARLRGHVLHVPPARERVEDIGLLIGRLLAKIANERTSTLRIALEAARALVRYSWPRNVRELEMALGHAVAIATGDQIELADLPDEVQHGRALHTLSTIDDDRRQALERLLEQFSGNVSHVARAMGKARPLVQKWIRRYGIDAERYRRQRER